MVAKKISWVLILLLLVSLTACGKKHPDKEVLVEPDTKPTVQDETITEETPIEEDLHIGQAINPLTGLYISEQAALRRPVGIMINNLQAALPQSGIAQADIIYETLVEGSICRLFAVFQDFSDVKKIGPVRSARHYFLDFAFDFDAIYMHYGESPQAQVAFTKLDSDHLNGLSYLDTIMCFQDPTRKRPHSTYTSFDGLMAGWDSKGYRKERDLDLKNKFYFSDEAYVPDSTVTATKVKLVFSKYQESSFEYNEQEGLYARFQFGNAQMDVETNEQLKTKNIIVQMTDIWGIPGDKEGRMDMALIGSGTGYYMTNGISIPITWEKASHNDTTQYFNMDGTVLMLNKGKTWIAVFPSNREDFIILE